MGKKRVLCDPSEGVKPVIIMLMAEAVVAGANIFYKLAVIDGMSMGVLASYKFLFSTAFLLPLALIFERKSVAELTWKIAFLGFLSGLFGGPLTLNLFIETMTLTSVTFATAMSNLIPAVTFIFIVTLRMESLAIRTMAGKAKLVGSVLSLGGAMILTFYKGKEINFGSTNINLAKHEADDHHVNKTHALLGNQVLGSMLGLAYCLSFSIWNIVHGKLSENYPYKYSCTALMSITASIQSIIYAIIRDRNWSEWKLGWNIRLLSSFYTVLISYRFIFASAFLLPLAFIFERKNKAKLTWKIAFQGFLLGLFGGALGQNLFIGSLALTSATFATAMSNLIPAVTFLLLLILRLERLEMKTNAGMAKLVGTLVSIGGAMILTFYKGPQICACSTNIKILKYDHGENDHLITKTRLSLGNHVLGSILALIACFSYAFWFIIQAKMNENYPYIYSSSALMCISASIQATVYALITERNWSAWKLGWNIRLFTAFYTAVIIMLGIQAVLAGVSVLYKLAVNQGMSMQVLIAYRFIFASAFLLPLSFILERKNEAKLTRKIVFQGCLSGLFGGALGQNLFIGSLALTSATFAQAMSNLIPAVTFLLLLIFRLERLEMRTSAGMAKLVGTVISIVGAMILTFYKGPRICVCSTNINLDDDHHENHRINTHLSLGSQVLGSILALLSCFSFALWFIIQAKMNKNYPFIYSSTALLCISASIQSTIYALITESNWSAWKLGWNIRLLTAFYSGTISTGLIMVATTWCIRLKGPLFVSIFGPLALIYVAIAGTLVLNETLHLGRKVLVAYRFIFASAFVIPLALILERESSAKLTWKIMFQGFLSGLFGGALGPNLFIASLTLTSATFATAVSNLVPVATLILAVILRLETLGIKTKAGQAKLVGTLVSIGGAMVLTFYKGKEIKLWSTNINLAKHAGNHATASQHFTNHFLGSLLALASCTSFAIWYIVIAKISENYPFIYSSSALMCITASIQATIYTIITERNWEPLEQHLTVVLMTWCLRLRGALFVSIFNPVNLILVAIPGFLILDESLDIGSILGSVLIVLGVYVVLWGKAKEKKNSPQIPAEEDQNPVESETLDMQDLPISFLPDIATALAKLYDPLFQWFQTHPSPPTAIISDVLLSSWTTKLASNLKIPNICFFPFNVRAVYSWLNNPNRLDSFYRDAFTASFLSWGLVFNSFKELEGAKVEIIKENFVKHDRIWVVGPLPPVKASDKERGGPSSIPQDEVIAWLDSCHVDKSVVYVGFGSQITLTKRQMEAVATALEQSGVRFIWAVKDPMKRAEDDRRDDDQSVIPIGFEDRTAGRGLVIKGWAPQVAILRHRAVGCYLTHCGWNSALESIVAGVLLLAWPMQADHFHITRVLVDEFGVAIRVCNGLRSIPDPVKLGQIFVESTSMGQRPESVRAMELQKTALEAINKGGSSYQALDQLIQQISCFDAKIIRSSMKVLVSYRFIFASAFLIPLALILESRVQPSSCCNLNLGRYLKVREIGNQNQSRTCQVGGHFASIQATIYTIITERNWSAWKLGWNIRLLSAFFTGAIGTALTVVLMTWCLRLRGPLFVSIFNPVNLIFVAIAGFLILDERLDIGSILGSVLIVLGVYVVLWGKAKEKKKNPPQIPAEEDQIQNPVESETLDIVISSLQETNQSSDTTTSKENSIPVK
ncbi:Drug/metabolite transporter [Corchorus capsularis]|uniref:Drug/metabolite transporter n=1 Tax=Corchorus capsularis TaxID=210143 RepID=A0A1R3GCT2_COCAP|nr:Drug/metabolite transporter [Corchorus capsularis]